MGFAEDQRMKAKDGDNWRWLVAITVQEIRMKRSASKQDSFLMHRVIQVGQVQQHNSQTIGVGLEGETTLSYHAFLLRICHRLNKMELSTLGSDGQLEYVNGSFQAVHCIISVNRGMLYSG